MSPPGISKGDAAAIGVGAGIAVVMVAGLAVAAFYLLRKGSCFAKETTDPFPQHVASTVDIPLSAHLLPSQNPGSVGEEFTRLDTFIKNHIHNCYHLVSISPMSDSPSLYESLSQLGLSEDTRRLVVRLSIDPNTRQVAIRHLLVRVIFSNLDIYFPGPRCLLPPVVSTLFESIPETKAEGREAIGNYSLHFPYCYLVPSVNGK